MALWRCDERRGGCGTRYAVAAPACPQCGGTEHIEDGEDMPKITVHGGASYETDVPATEPGPAYGTDVSAVPPAESGPVAPVTEPAVEPEPARPRRSRR